ncbi:MAG: penicillin-binding protein 2 [Pseudomonadota bacterium]|nr:penicillin-binding protein 2 [Pseudomonadota bacterium]
MYSAHDILPTPKARRAAPAGRQRARLGDNAYAAHRFTRRAVVALLLVLLALGSLIGRLAWLQVTQHAHFTTLADGNRMRLQPLTPSRGLIFDRHGVLLADNLSSYRLEITLDQVEDLERTLERLKTLIALSDHDISRFRRLARRNPYNGVPLRFRLNEEEVARVAVDQHRLPGVAIQADLTRHYPLGAHAAHAVGYVGRIDEEELQRIDASQYSGSSHIGKVGVEKFYEDLLRGRVGHQQVETNAQGRILRVLESTAPVPGRSLYLTLDSRLQRVAEEAMADYTGAIVAIDPNNGDVLALVSQPGYDANLFVNGIDPATYRDLNASPDRPLFNRALRGMYPPGSTIKPLVGLAGLAYGVTSARAGTYCPGFYRLPGVSHRFRDWKRGGHGHTNLNKGIVQSCDVYFYNLAAHLGINRLHDFLAHFGLGAPTGIDLTGEKPGLLPSPEWKQRTQKQPWYTGETLIAGIGQGYMLVTPLQLAQATAVLASRGQAYRPRLVYAVEEQSGGEKQLLAPTPTPPFPQTDPRHWDQVLEAMVDVVHSPQGTARRSGLGAPYRIAGKTGTAQVFSLGQNEKYNAKELDRRLHDHALFIAFAPAEAPRIAVAVIAEHGGGGSATAAPMARRVLDAYLLDRHEAQPADGN